MLYHSSSENRIKLNSTYISSKPKASGSIEGLSVKMFWSLRLWSI